MASIVAHGPYATIYILGDKSPDGKMEEITQALLGLIGGCTFHVSKENTGNGRFSSFHTSQISIPQMFCGYPSASGTQKQALFTSHEM